MARPPKSKVAPGIYEKDHGFWLRYTYDAKQVRVRLGTNDPAEAIKRADELRGRPPVDKKTGRVIQGKPPIERAVEKYSAGKLKSGDFGNLASKNACQAVRDFSKTMGISDPQQITSENLSAYYQKTRKAKSEATAQTYVSRVATFARGCGLRVSTPEFSSPTPSRDVVISKERVEELLELATGDLKFVLYCGFRAGMRRGEICMARPSWFDLARRVIRIPCPDPVTGWVPKSNRPRTIPLVSEFAEFIQATFPDWNTRSFCLRPDKKVGQWIYRFDFRKLMAAFSAKHCPELTAHVMRHTFTSHHANNPRVSIAKLSQWTGDRIATLERHYIHLESDADEAAESFKTKEKAPVDMVFGDPNAPDQGMPPPESELRKRRLEGE